MARESDSDLEKKVASSRKERNEDLIQRMQRKEALWSYDSQASWFPPRPIIKKDVDRVKELYGDAENTDTMTKATEVAEKKPVSTTHERGQGVVIDLAKRRKKD